MKSTISFAPAASRGADEKSLNEAHYDLADLDHRLGALHSLADSVQQNLAGKVSGGRRPEDVSF